MATYVESVSEIKTADASAIMKTIIKSAMPRERDGLLPGRATGLLVELCARGVPIGLSLIGLIEAGNKPF
jgi:hypothetical protein